MKQGGEEAQSSAGGVVERDARHEFVLGLNHLQFLSIGSRRPKIGLADAPIIVTSRTREPLREHRQGSMGDNPRSDPLL